MHAILVFVFFPSQNFPYKTIDLQVTIPHDYPTQPLTVQLSDDQGLPPAYITHGNQAISHYLATAVGKPGELMFRPFLHWLDKTITSVFKEAAKQVGRAHSSFLSTFILGAWSFTF